ncbi:efflux RND transporter periplasmic adaptor subunit [Bacteroides sp.]|uniref:efflux RND transporter periplasmic adaptor subunit n=1 Tax=Bacteroides sp. TaxID=29523 RepID=UPI00258767F8|nr:efflux RND transporter periplasmic adaptor subunit [Bacteroides sp.]
MKKYIKYAVFIIIGLLFIQTFVFLYKKSQPKKVMYETVQPQVKDIEKSTVATGTVEPRDEVLIKPQISGIIDKLYKEAGQTVKKDEIIARVKVIPELGQLSSTESRVNTARVNLRQAEKDHERMTALFEKGLISKEEYEKDKVTIDNARIEYQAAKDSYDIVKEGFSKSQADLSNTLIRSTIDGLILDIPIKEGNSVILSNNFNDGTTIATVANMDDLIFKGYIDETEVGKVHEGMNVKLSIGALQNFVFDATLEYISPKAKQENGANLFEIKAAVERPDSVFIRSGYSANATIVLNAATQILTVPERVVEMSNDSAFVWVEVQAGENQKFEKKSILVGLSNGIDIEVKNGLTTEEKLRGLPIN